MRGLRHLAALIVLALTSQPALSTGNDAAGRAASALADGRYGHACGELDALEDEPDGWFVRGRCAALSGRHGDALRWYGRLLAVVDAPRARLEYARSLAAIERKEDATEAFEKVLRSNPPEPIRSWIFAELAELNASRPTASYKTTAGLWLVQDTNANVGPRSPSLTIFGLPFELEDRALGQADHALNSWLVIDRNEVIAPGLLSLSLRFDDTRYAKLTALSYQGLSAQAQLRQGLGDVVATYSVTTQALHQRNGAGRDGVVVSGAISTAISADWTASGSLSVGRNKRAQAADRYSTPMSGELNIHGFIGSATRLVVGLRGLGERFAAADQSHDDYSLYGTAESSAQVLCAGCSWKVLLSRTASHYAAEDLLFEMVRRDSLAEASVSLSGPLEALSAKAASTSWRANVDISSNKSTIPLNRYDRARYGISVEMVF